MEKDGAEADQSSVEDPNGLRLQVETQRWGEGRTRTPDPETTAHLPMLDNEAPSKEKVEGGDVSPVRVVASERQQQFQLRSLELDGTKLVPRKEMAQEGRKVLHIRLQADANGDAVQLGKEVMPQPADLKGWDLEAIGTLVIRTQAESLPWDHNIKTGSVEPEVDPSRKVV